MLGGLGEFGAVDIADLTDQSALRDAVGRPGQKVDPRPQGQDSRGGKGSDGPAHGPGGDDRRDSLVGSRGGIAAIGASEW